MSATQQVKIVFLANAGSPHVRHWVQFLDEMQLTYHVYSIHPNALLPPERVTLKFEWLSRRGTIASLLAYALLGLWLRLKAFGDQCIFHAHNTSGYGMSAFLSGRPYIVTTYGTEIFAASSRSRVYRRLIALILHRARKVTASSHAMTQELQNSFGVPESRIQTFSMSVAPAFRYCSVDRACVRRRLGIALDAHVWVYNRRIMPLYHTLEVVEAFQQFSKLHPLSHLVLMGGDCTADYLNQVRSVVKDDPRITLIEGFLGQHEMAQYLCAGDVAISLPASDQLSSSILEALACGCLPMIANLPAYDSVRDAFPHVVVSDFRVESIVDAFIGCHKALIEFPDIREQVIPVYKRSGWTRSGGYQQIFSLYDLPGNARC